MHGKTAVYQRKDTVLEKDTQKVLSLVLRLAYYMNRENVLKSLHFSSTIFFS